MDMLEKVKWLEEEIMEEIAGAKTYMNCASMWDNKDAEIASTFRKMAKQEMSHAEQLNMVVDRILEKHLTDYDMKKIPELIRMINRDQISDARNYIPEIDPEVAVQKPKGA